MLEKESRDEKIVNSPEFVDRMVRENEGLIHMVFRRHFYFYGHLKEDMLQEGRIALMKSAQTFDSARSSFAYYSITNIGRAMIRFI